MALSASESMASESSAAIDRRHLARMTLGDRSLEQEVLQLFDRQASLLIERMRLVDRDGDGAALRHRRDQRREQLGPVGLEPADAVARGRRGEGHGQRGGELRVALAEQGREQARADRGLFFGGELEG